MGVDPVARMAAVETEVGSMAPSRASCGRSISP